MATISMFFGIVVIMYNESAGKHHAPHVHARYAEFSCSLDFEGEVLDGYLPVSYTHLAGNVPRPASGLRLRGAARRNDERRARRIWDLRGVRGGFGKKCRKTALFSLRERAWGSILSNCVFPQNTIRDSI